MSGPVARRSVRGTARRIADEPVHVSYWRRALRWLAAPNRTYTAVVLVSGSVLVYGIGLIAVPAALIVAGAAGGALGLIGLGITVRSAER